MCCLDEIVAATLKMDQLAKIFEEKEWMTELFLW
jgi:hypothetical protein